MKRTPLARRTPLAAGNGIRRQSRVKPMSQKRQAANAVRRVVVAQLLSQHPACQIRWACQGARAVDVHERLKRSRGGSITDPDHGHMVTACRPCHELTEAEPAEASRRRMLLPSWHQCAPGGIGPC